jgi:hypothetical protein
MKVLVAQHEATQRRAQTNKLWRSSANHSTAYSSLLLGLSSKIDNHQDKLI